MTTHHRPTFKSLLLSAAFVLPGAAVPALLAGAGAHAQAQVDTITVTARRVEESLQDTPISVTALTATALERQSISNIVDLASTVPNLNATNGPQSGSDANFFIRGVGQFDFIITNDPAVGVYVDGVYLGRTVGALLDTGDVERIEVLRGPQGTLFGRNTIGGAVNVTTRAPNLEETEANAKLTLGERDRVDVEAGFSAPLSDTFGVRLHAQSRQQEGWATRPTDGATFGDFERVSVSGSALWEPNDVFNVIARADWSDTGGSPNPSRLVDAVPGFGMPGMPPVVPPNIYSLVPGEDYAFASRDRDLATLSIPADYSTEVAGGSLTAEYDSGAVTFKSITAYRTLEALTYSDNDGSFFPIYDQSSTLDQSQFSQEFQAIGDMMDGRVNWLAGLYYFGEEARQVQNLCLASFGIPFAPAPDACVYSSQDNDQTTTSYAAFANVDIMLSERWSVNLGGRYTEEDKEITTTQGLFAPAPGVFPPQIVFIPALVGFNDEVSYNDFNPKIGVEYQAGADVLLYASYSQGFRSGGFNGRVFPPSTTLVSFEPDTNNTYEAGFKSELFDNRVRLNGAAFISQYEDIQQTVTDPVLLFFIANAAEAELSGFELEMSAVPVEDTLIELGIGYTQSEFTEVDPGLIPARITVGNSLPFTPEWSVNFAIQHRFVLRENLGVLTPRLDYNWLDDFYFSPANQPAEFQESYGLLNVRLGWESADGRYQAAVFGRNVTDEDYDTFGQDATFNQGVAYRHTGRPSEWGVSFAIQY
ncbi:MAG: TonB-dependent receptor [Oceanicaulis sp.]